MSVCGDFGGVTAKGTPCQRTSADGPCPAHREDAKPGGRPKTIETPQEFESRAQEYFDSCVDKGRPITITGLALGLGFADRQSLYDYQSRPEFSGAVKRARLRVENAYEILLATGAVKATGPIFALKQMGWSDKQELQHTGPAGGPVEVAVTRKVVKAPAVAPANRISEHMNGANGNGRA